ncbi:hypothetical protein MPTK1_1g08420 [Marchantia polymorpha subsp. ruderalis]|uniref:Uncharacterized protein n=2 Tax=Marchantia polymorpha TaxID=3197 RepID=A0AAF6AMX9_MARPO|nr:hypothetical protein MARPO_0036s0085 [Marchantia polymorpha]BBM97799.1 hypothetical protein Mp_1g08420 [Marchantia polymorpha subsp. ruderalis]|eukprot:PTQ41102.1 hypothetical protein MARPO_0036s0085 [Marchantia polymorpha]
MHRITRISGAARVKQQQRDYRSRSSFHSPNGSRRRWRLDLEGRPDGERAGEGRAAVPAVVVVVPRPPPRPPPHADPIPHKRGKARTWSVERGTLDCKKARPLERASSKQRRSPVTDLVRSAAAACLPARGTNRCPGRAIIG